MNFKCKLPENSTPVGEKTGFFPEFKGDTGIFALYSSISSRSWTFAPGICVFSFLIFALSP
jgi:hypothetical protein